MSLCTRNRSTFPPRRTCSRPCILEQVTSLSRKCSFLWLCEFLYIFGSLSDRVFPEDALCQFFCSTFWLHLSGKCSSYRLHQFLRYTFWSAFFWKMFFFASPILLHFPGLLSGVHLPVLIDRFMNRSSFLVFGENSLLYLAAS